MVEVTVHFGTDIDSNWSANPQGDLTTITELSNAEQAIYNRLTTQFGELNELGYTDYGNEAYNVIGETDIESAKQEIIIYTTNCLLTEPRVESIENIRVEYNQQTATIYCDLKLIGEDKGTNLIINIGEEI